LERWLGHSERSRLRSRPRALGNLHQVGATDPVLLAPACARQEIHTVAGFAHQAGTCWVGSDPATLDGLLKRMGAEWHRSERAHAA
jgi:hypothetical protein